METIKPRYHQDVEANQSERNAFEQWYVLNAFDYVLNPIGSRDCDLQWRAWLARSRHES
jgi:hypothetical protein